MIRLASIAFAVLTPLASGPAGARNVVTGMHRLGTVAARPNCRVAPHGSGILSDGDFSQAPDPGTWQGIVEGTQFAPDWIVSRRTIDFYGRTDAWPVPGGLCSVDLDGSGPRGVGGITHAPVSTTVGATYTLGFLFSGNGQCAPSQRGPAIKTLLVEARGVRGALGQVFTWHTRPGHDAEHGDFVYKTWTFRAVDKQTQISFTSLDRPVTSNCGPVVAAISMK